MSEVPPTRRRWFQASIVTHYHSYVGNASLCFRLAACLVLLSICAGSGVTPPLANAESLAELLRPRLPKGWTLLLKDEQVVLERTEPVELYNGLGLPAVNQDAEISAESFAKD